MPPNPKTRAKNAQAHHFRALVREAITDEQVQAICAMLAESAIGDRNIIAAKLLFNYLGGPPRVPIANDDDSGVRIFLPKVPTADRRPQTAVDAPQTETRPVGESGNPLSAHADQATNEADQLPSSVRRPPSLP